MLIIYRVTISFRKSPVEKETHGCNVHFWRNQFNGFENGSVFFQEVMIGGSDSCKRDRLAICE